jgi:hypothetical protein
MCVIICINGGENTWFIWLPLMMIGHIYIYICTPISVMICIYLIGGDNIHGWEDTWFIWLPLWSVLRYVYICTYICTNIYVIICIYTRWEWYIYTYVHTCTHVYTYLYIYIYKYNLIRMITTENDWSYIHIHMYTHMCYNMYIFNRWG